MHIWLLCFRSPKKHKNEKKHDEKTHQSALVCASERYAWCVCVCVCGFYFVLYLQRLHGKSFRDEHNVQIDFIAILFVASQMQTQAHSHNTENSNADHQINKCSFINFHCTLVLFSSSSSLQFSLDRLKHGIVAHFTSLSARAHTHTLTLCSN